MIGGTKTVLSIGLLVTILNAAGAENWQAGTGAEWKQVMAAAKREGKVVVAGHPALAKPLAQAFARDTGLVLEYLGGNPGDLAARLEREAQAGKLTIDLALGGGSELLSLYPRGLLKPIKPQLLLPGVTAGQHWIGGKMKWMDRQGQYFFQGSNWVHAWPVINANVVNVGAITSWKDLLKPEYQGKIAAHDPRTGGPGQAAAAYVTDTFGVDFLKKLYLGQKVVYTKDGRQLMEWAARGTYPIVLGAVQLNVEQFKAVGGFNLKVLDLQDGPGSLLGGFSVLKQPKRGPHPNAATVFINWYASRPGQEAYAQTMLESSTRADVHVSAIPDYVIPKPGVRYLDQFSQDWYTNVRPRVAKEIIAALGGR